MPGPITYAAVTLLARDRIGQIRRALQAKKDAGTAKELELHVLFLATEAEKMMKASEPVITPPLRLYAPPLTDQVSRFLLLGAVGPDLPRYAAYFAPGQRWLFDTLHKGTPDEHREKVLANSTNLVFDFWKRVTTHIDADFSNEKKRKAAKEQMQAYVLGHLAHVATDVLAHPYFEALETRLSVPPAPPNPGIRFMRREDLAGALDIHVSNTFFKLGTDTRNKQWADWFPTPGDVPNAFGKAMAESITALYGARAAGLPAFDEAFGKIDPAPPGLTAGLIDESVSYFRTIMEIERVWTLGDWLGATAAMFLPMVFAYFGALALPLGKDLTRELTAEDGPDAKAVRRYESIVFPVAASSLIGPWVSMIIVSASGRGLRAEGITGWIHAGLSLVASIAFFASLGGAGAARWVLLFALPLVLAVAQTIFVLVRGAGENSRTLLYLGPIVQVALALLFMLLYQVWLHDGVEQFGKKSDERNNLAAFGDFAAWLAIVVVLWIIHAVLWRYVFSRSVPDDKDGFAPEPQKYLRLYDDVGLVHDFKAPVASEKLSDFAYPPARRPILEMWWEDAGGTTMRIDIKHDQLVFKSSSPTVLDQTVFAPPGPITIARWATLLAESVTGDATNGQLHVKPARDDEKEIELAPGSLFADNGDDKTVQSEHDTAAAAPAPIGGTEAAAFTLYHTPRPRLAVQMGRGGVAADAKRAEAASKPGCVLKPVATNPRQYHSDNATDGTSPVLQQLLAPGDVLEIASGGPPGEQRIVEDVISQTDVIVSAPFQFAIPAAGVGFKRAASDRSVPVPGGTLLSVPAVQAGVLPNDVQAVAAPPFFFSATLKVGDTIEVKSAPKTQRRVITAIKDLVNIGSPPVQASLLTLDAVLAPAPPAAGFAFERMAAEAEDGFVFMAEPDDTFGAGGSVMNDAADLAALLMLGGASRIQFEPPDPAVAPPTPVHRVSQVFRNWNLDRRRVNEWKMMVSGGAASERRGDFSVADEAASIDPADAGEAISPALLDKRKAGEATVRSLGWLGAFRSWVDVASRPASDTTANVVFRPGGPSNRDLTRAMAYLLDSSETAVP